MTNQGERKFDIQERTLDFAAKIAIFAGNMPKTIVSVVYIKQLIRSSASIGANVEEADGTLTKKDFINKLAIARREARETKYWLKLANKCLFYKDNSSCNEMDLLIKEAHELMLILSSIINKVQNKL